MPRIGLRVAAMVSSYLKSALIQRSGYFRRAVGSFNPGARRIFQSQSRKKNIMAILIIFAIGVFILSLTMGGLFYGYREFRDMGIHPERYHPKPARAFFR